jgi:hypothetical protein
METCFALQPFAKLILDTSSFNPLGIPNRDDVGEGISQRRFKLRHAADMDFWEGRHEGRIRA